ncbi:hypothetical protein SAV31267_046540 [Streptomyces avermitilis]|uniref:PPE family domain-containing protein n=1 Tax=Streptomyces avermitilis TaxID=33903 RepID=A0A4D4MUZ0_STRAX|nr:hypothetical protein SAV31267_046540 [Streptomyces avermitilis]
MSDLGSSAWRTVRQSRFLTQDPEQLWSMVEGADGATATELGVLLTQAAKTIGEIGTDLRTHSMAVEWEGEGGEAFRKWIHQAALATLGLGDYSASAGKWLGHAGDTLHEVRPQLEILRNQSATARSVLDAHAAKATDIGDHDGSPSDAAVEKAKTSFADDSAEAAGLMIKLAQSYTASTEQIDALKAPEFPELPKRFVPIERDGGTHITAPTADGGTQGTVARADALGRETDADSGVGGMSSAPRASAPHHLTDLAVGPDAPPRPHTDTTNTAIDSVRTVPSAPAAPSAPPAPPPEPSSPDGRTQPTTGLLPPAFGGRAVTPQVPRAGGGTPCMEAGVPCPRRPAQVHPEDRTYPGADPPAPSAPACPVVSRSQVVSRPFPARPETPTESLAAARSRHRADDPLVRFHAALLSAAPRSSSLPSVVAPHREDPALAPRRPALTAARRTLKARRRAPPCLRSPMGSSVGNPGHPDSADGRGSPQGAPDLYGERAQTTYCRRAAEQPAAPPRSPVPHTVVTAPPMTNGRAPARIRGPRTRKADRPRHVHPAGPTDTQDKKDDHAHPQQAGPTVRPGRGGRRRRPVGGRRRDARTR